VAFDPFLYVALGIGFVVGRVVRIPSGWVQRASLVTVVGLVGLLGGSIAPLSDRSLAEAIPIGLGGAGLILLCTIGAFLLLSDRSAPPKPVPAKRTGRSRGLISAGLLVALLVGFALGRSTSLAFASGIPWALYLLLGIVGLDLRIHLSEVRRAWVPLLSGVLGALVAAAVLFGIARIAPGISLATTLAFGWYTPAGPLVTARAGAALGLIAFLTNFFRENLTMLLSPSLGRRLRGEGLTAMGGATSMDTTLYFITQYGDAEAGGLALTCGLIFTLAAGLLLPVLLSV